MLKELVGYGNTDKAVYPITSTGAVFDSNSTSLDSIIADLYAKIKDAGGSSSGGSGSGSDSGGKGEKGDKGDPGETYDYVPCFIYFHPEDNVVPKKPVGGSYNFTNKVLTPPAGWKISYSGMSKPIYMSIGIACSKAGSTIEWSSPFIAFSDGTGGGNLPYDPVPESNYKTLFIYKHSDEQPDMPVGGSYDFNTQRIVLPDGGWQLTKDNLENPVYMSIGFCSKNKTGIEWSYPIVVADGNGLGPGKTPANDILTKTFVVVAYKKDTSSEGPATPSSSDGNVNFTTSPYTITPPNGWSLDRTMAVNDNVWCTIKVFHQTSKNDYDNSSTPWSKPVKANLANINLTADQVQLIADHIEVDSNEIETNFDKWIAQGSNIQMIANKIAETADIYTVTSGQYVVNADFIEQVANKAISASNFKQDVIMDASGKIVAQITADDSGLYSTIANNIVQEAIKDKDNEGGIIYLVAKDVTDNIKSEIEVGTDDSGNGFIKAIANSIDFNSNAFNSIVTNAVSGEVSKMTQTGGYINQTVTDLTNNHLSSMTLTPEQLSLIAPNVKLNTKDLETVAKNVKLDADDLGIVAKNVTIDATKINLSSNPGADDLQKAVVDKVVLAIGDGATNSNQKKILDVIADEVDINGLLNAVKLTINKNNIVLDTDGSGYIANQNIIWDSDGNLNLKGNIEANCLRYNIEELRPTVNNATITLDPIRDKCSMYLIICDDTTMSALNTAKFMLPNNLKPGTSFKIVATVYGEKLAQMIGTLFTFYVGTSSNNLILGYKMTSGNYAATKVELKYYCLYEFTYLGYDIWSLTGDCATYTDAFKSNSSK